MTNEEASKRTRAASAIPAAIHAALGLAGEVGETVEHVKKAFFYSNRPMDPEALKLELSDVLYYLTWLANTYGLTLSEIMQANIDKLTARFPEKFDR